MILLTESIIPRNEYRTNLVPTGHEIGSVTMVSGEILAFFMSFCTSKNNFKKLLKSCPILSLPIQSICSFFFGQTVCQPVKYIWQSRQLFPLKRRTESQIIIVAFFNSPFPKSHLRQMWSAVRLSSVTFFDLSGLSCIVQAYICTMIQGHEGE